MDKGVPGPWYSRERRFNMRRAHLGQDPKMCTGGIPCLHGECVTNATDKTMLAVCVCDELYSGSQCGFRSGLLYFELPLASVVIFVFVIMGLRVSGTVWTMLRFPESKHDFFEFPRVFEPTKKDLGRLQPFIGTWEGPAHKQFSLRHRPLTVVLVVVAVVMELLPLLQVAAIAFLPAIPWPTTSKLTGEFLRLLILQPLWSHQQAHEYSHDVFYSSVAVVPAMLLLACVLGIKRFPLFKPQSTNSATEDLSSITLRAFSAWMVLPVMIALLMPLECFFVGYLRRGSVMMVPVYDPVCFTWIRLGHVVLGFTTTATYNFLASGVAIQLNCESSPPKPTMWTDARYTWISQSIYAPLALSVVVFGNSNPLALCIFVTLAGLSLLFLNAWMRPCIYSLVNWLRLYGAVLASWSGIAGMIASISDDPLYKTTYEIWSLGAIALSAVTFSALFVHYTEEFWFKLSFFGGKPWPAVGSMKTVPVSVDDGKAALEPIDKSSSTHGTVPKLLHPKLAPLHAMRKRSRRSTAPVNSKFISST